MIRLCLLLLLVPGLAQATCRQALSLGLDVSRSVDDTEYELQRDGVIAALNADAVRAILFAQPDAPIRVHVFEWSSQTNQTVIVPWTTVTGPDDLVNITGLLRAHRRGEKAPSTAIGTAILAGFDFLTTQSDCWIRTLDLSGDGENNSGLLPEQIPPELRPPNVTVNGLVVGSGNFLGDTVSGDALGDLRDYYQLNVIRGPNAFVEVAEDYLAYAATMERKLIRELSSQVLGGLPALSDRDG